MGVCRRSYPGTHLATGTSVQDPHVGPLAPAAASGSAPGRDPDASPHRDPVCGRELGSSPSPYRTEYADVTYQFCSSSCLQRFVEQPDIFTAQPGRGQVAERDRALRPETHTG